MDRDDELVLAALGGDRRAAGELLRRHRPLLVTLCRRALGDIHLAEDAAQEAALIALGNLARLRQPRRFGAWLGGIGLNVCRRWLREDTRAAWSLDALLGGRVVDEPVDPGPGPPALAEAAEIAGRVRAAVGALPGGQRAAVVGYYLAGLTVAELATELGTSAGAVKVRLHKGRRGLRRALEPVWREAGTPRPTAGSASGPTRREEALMATTAGEGGAGTLVAMRVAEVRRSLATGGSPERWMVVLAEVGGERRLTIWIGRHEAISLGLAADGAELVRPLSYQLMASLLEASGGRLREVRIDRLSEGTYYATVEVEGPAGRTAVDARPSDALNLAQLTGAPIGVTEDVLVAGQTAMGRLLAGAGEPELMTARAISELFQADHQRTLAAVRGLILDQPDPPGAAGAPGE